MKNEKPRRVAKKGEAALAVRVTALEDQVSSLLNDMRTLGDQLEILRMAVRQVDERQIRGEKVLLAVQVDSRRTLKTVERISAALNVENTATDGAPALEAKNEEK